MSKAWEKGSSYQWRKIRAQILQDNQLSNNGVCRLSIDGVCSGRATQVHHTLGRAITGDDPRYLLAVCGPCNTKVGDPATYKEPPSTISEHWL